jgi:hypothetical protein
MYRNLLFAAVALLSLTSRASAQFAEGPGALGMGGAYVAVQADPPNRSDPTDRTARTPSSVR